MWVTELMRGDNKVADINLSDSQSIRHFTENMWQNERKEVSLKVFSVRNLYNYQMESRARAGEGINRKSSIKRYNNSNKSDKL